MLYGQLRKTEQQFAIAQFQSHAQRALKDCSDVVYRQRLSSESLALMISSQFHNSSDWPYVVVPGFEKIIHPLSLAGKTAGMGFAPVLQSGVEQARWEVCSLFVICDVYLLLSYSVSSILIVVSSSLSRISHTITSISALRRATFLILQASKSLAKVYGGWRTQRMEQCPFMTMTR